MPDYTLVNLNEIDDAAAQHGFGDLQEARFPRDPLGLHDSGLGHLVVKAGVRQPFAHRHEEAEEVHVMLNGSGRVKLDDEVLDVAAGDVLRVGPGVTRMFEAGADGLEYVVFSPRHEGDAEVVPGFWDD